MPKSSRIQCIPLFKGEGEGELSLAPDSGGARKLKRFNFSPAASHPAPHNPETLNLARQKALSPEICNLNSKEPVADLRVCLGRTNARDTRKFILGCKADWGFHERLTV